MTKVAFKLGGFVSIDGGRVGSSVTEILRGYPGRGRVFIQE